MNSIFCDFEITSEVTFTNRRKNNYYDIVYPMINLIKIPKLLESKYLFG